MKKKLAVALCGCAALVLTLSACGDSDEKVDAWAQSICDQVRPQVEKIQAANAAIAEASSDDRSPAEVQEADAAAFRDMSEAYAALADAVDQAGDPPVDDGARLRQDAVTELRDISDSYAELTDSVESLDTSDHAHFAEGLQEVAGRLETLGQSGDEALNELQGGKLGEAMARQEGCQSSSASPGEEEGQAEGAEEGAEGAENEDGAADEGEDDGEGAGSAEEDGGPQLGG